MLGIYCLKDNDNENFSISDHLMTVWSGGRNNHSRFSYDQGLLR